MKKYRLLNGETGEEIIRTIPEILDDVNSDRSPFWIPYTEADWREGVEWFTEYIIMGEDLPPNWEI